jgi:hypothetical protein
VRRLALAGTVAILVFATIGQLSHHGGVSASGYAADLLPLLGCWLAAAWWTRRFVPTWIVGVTAGIAIRTVVLSHYRWSELSFLLVALTFVGALAFALLAVPGLVRRGLTTRTRRNGHVPKREPAQSNRLSEPERDI